MKNKYQFNIKEIGKDLALQMVQKYHYSNTLPRLNKHYIGFYLDEKLVGVITLGWGTRPLHTIKKLFPSLETKDYYEIGRMCMTEEMPRNSESQMISQLCKWLKQNDPGIKVLFTWADGMLGKPGYVYQASGFMYCGFNETDIYLKDGVKIHPRQTKALFSHTKNDKRLTVRPTIEQMKEYNIQHYRGYQFKYFRFLCGKIEKKRLMKECLLEISKDLPKEKDLKWRVQDLETGKWVKAQKPKYKTDFDVDSREETITLNGNDNSEDEYMISLFSFNFSK